MFNDHQPNTMPDPISQRIRLRQRLDQLRDKPEALGAVLGVLVKHGKLRVTDFLNEQATAEFDADLLKELVDAAAGAMRAHNVCPPAVGGVLRLPDGTLSRVFQFLPGWRSVECVSQVSTRFRLAMSACAWTGSVDVGGRVRRFRREDDTPYLLRNLRVWRLTIHGTGVELNKEH